MLPTRVAAISMNGFMGQPERVLQAIDGWCARAAAAGAQLAVFPELVVHGHCTPNTWEVAEPVPDGPAGAATLFELLGEIFEGRLRQRQSGDHRDALATAPLSFTTDPDHRLTACCRGGDDVAGHGAAFCIDVHSPQSRRSTSRLK